MEPMGQRRGQEGGARKGQEEHSRASSLPMSTLMASGSSPVKNFLLKLMPSKST